MLRGDCLYCLIVVIGCWAGLELIAIGQEINIIFAGPQKLSKKGGMMRKCPFCAQELPDQAAKCPNCANPLTQTGPEKWYFKTTSLVIGFIAAGPFILPLVWANHRFSRKKKIIISLIMIAITAGLGLLTLLLAKTVHEYYRAIYA